MKLAQIKVEARQWLGTHPDSGISKDQRIILALVAIAEAAEMAEACFCSEERCEALEDFRTARKALEAL